MPDQWTHKQFLERFSVLNAMRLPPGCLEGVSRDLSLVNTFVIVLSCVEDKPLRKVEDRYFISAYDNGPAHGWIVEYDSSAKSVVKHNRKAIERAQSGPKSVP